MQSPFAASADENEWLAVGHQSGLVVLWDRNGRKVLKAITDQHTAPVLYLHFPGDRQSLVSSDADGKVRSVWVCGWVCVWKVWWIC